MQTFLLSHHFTSQSSPLSYQDRDAGHSNTPPANTGAAPASVETFRVAAAARSFLNSVMLTPLLSPPPSSSTSSGSAIDTPSRLHASGSDGSGRSPEQYGHVHRQDYTSTTSPGSGRAAIDSPGVHLAPAPTISLIEKQLLMFLAAVAAESTNVNSNRNINNNSSSPRRQQQQHHQLSTVIPPRMAWDDVSSTHLSDSEKQQI